MIEAPMSNPPRHGAPNTAQVALKVSATAVASKNGAEGRGMFFFFSSRRRHTRFKCDWSSDVCSSDLFHHVGRQVVEDFWELAHSVGQGRAAFYRGADTGQRLLEGRILLVGRQNFQTLHQWQASVDHDRKLPKEDGNFFGLDLARSENGHRKFFALFPDRWRRDLLAPELHGQHLFVRGHSFAADFLACGVLSRKCENWHGFLSLPVLQILVVTST